MKEDSVIIGSKKLIEYKHKFTGKKITPDEYKLFSGKFNLEYYEPIYQDIQTSDSSVPVAENVVAGDEMKSAKEYFGKEYGFKHIERVVEMKDYKSLYGLMEEFASQYKTQPTDDELWGEVFAKIRQYGLNNKVLKELKAKFKITIR